MTLNPHTAADFVAVALRALGPADDREIVRRVNRCKRYCDSTIRGARVKLQRAGRVKCVGLIHDGHGHRVWGIV